MKGIKADCSEDSFYATVSQTIDRPDFLAFHQMMLERKGFQDFEVVQVYLRGGPSWIVFMNIDLRGMPCTSVEALAYFFAIQFRARKGALIGNGRYFQIDRDSGNYRMVEQEYLDLYQLEILIK
jgi:hypothetical protein